MTVHSAVSGGRLLLPFSVSLAVLPDTGGESLFVEPVTEKMLQGHQQRMQDFCFLSYNCPASTQISFWHDF